MKKPDLSGIITARMLKSADWQEVYSYHGKATNFKVFAAPEIKDFTITYDYKGTRCHRTTYRVGGKTVRTLTEAIREHNSNVRKRETPANIQPAEGSQEANV